MSITFHVPGTKPYCRVLSPLAQVILDLAGVPSYNREAGELDHETIRSVAGRLPRIPVTWTDGGCPCYRGAGQLWYTLGWTFTDEDDLRGYLGRKAAALKKVAGAAWAANQPVVYN